MILNLNFKLQDLDKKELTDTPLVSHLLANILASSRSKDPVKMMHIALKLYENGEIDLDLSDLDLLKNEILQNESLANLAKGQILEKIEGAKNTK